MASADIKPMVILPKNEKQKSLIEIFLKALDLEWKDETYINEKEYFAKIDLAIEQTRNGEVTSIKSEKELHSFIESL